jgi:hypothetical protein
VKEGNRKEFKDIIAGKATSTSSKKLQKLFRANGTVVRKTKLNLYKANVKLGKFGCSGKASTLSGTGQ